jgi:hypothetical protein
MPAPVLAEALVRWQHAAGPFWPYVCAAPFLGDDEGGIQRAVGEGRGWTRRQRALAEALTGEPGASGAMHRAPTESASVGARCIAPASGEGFSIVLVDLPPEPVLAVAPLLVAQGWYVVPVLQRWIASPAVLPCRRLMDVLLRGAWRARRPRMPRGAVLVADGTRAGPAGYPALAPGRAFDNRYAYQICRFPSLDFLRAQGVRRGRWITLHASGIASPDLAPYLEELLRGGIAMDVVPWHAPA